jgi:hypothetical protein
MNHYYQRNPTNHFVQKFLMTPLNQEDPLHHLFQTNPNFLNYQ